MNEADALDIIQSALWMVIVGAGPAIGAAMVVGVAIALLQALTQSELAVGGAVTSADGKTSGTVQSVSVDSSGAATATLTNGDTVTYANGAVVK